MQICPLNGARFNASYMSKYEEVKDNWQDFSKF